MPIFQDSQGLAENSDTFFCAQIEHIRALEQLESILSHPKLHAIMEGPYDLSGSMDLTGQFEHPDFISVLEQIFNKTKEFNLPMGIHVVEPDPEKLRNKITEGYRFIAYGIDAVFLSTKAELPRCDLENKK